MQLSLESKGIIGAALAICLVQGTWVHGAWAQGADGDSGRSDWYVGAGVGTNRTGNLKQAGYNRDNICYPTNICTRTPGGYRWFYDLDADTGSAFELAVGRSFRAVRLELTASNLRNGLEQSFTGLAYFDGSAVLPDMDSDYANTAETAMDDLTTRTLSVNVYRDFSLEGTGLEPYLGIGVGFSEVKLSGLYFRSQYSCVRGPCAGRPASEYDSSQQTDLTDSVLSTHLYAGTGYRLGGDRLVLDLKVAYRLVDDLSDEGGYLNHPIPDQLNTNEISGMEHWSLTIGLKYFL